MINLDAIGITADISPPQIIEKIYGFV